jgi:hypothetical protein
VKLARPDLAALALVGLVIVCATVCAVLHVEAPAFLTSIALFVAGIGGGIALPNGQTSTTSAPADVPPAVLPAPLPVAPPALTSEPATGVFRVASHAP